MESMSIVGVFEDSGCSYIDELWEDIHRGLSLEGVELQAVCKCDIGHTHCISMQLFSYALSRTKGCSISGSDGVLCDVMCCFSTVEKGPSQLFLMFLGG